MVGSNCESSKSWKIWKIYSPIDGIKKKKKEKKKRKIHVENHVKVKKKNLNEEKCEFKRKWWLDNIYVLYNWIVGMFFFFKMCILLSEKTNIFGSSTSLQPWKKPQDSCF